MPKLDGLGRKMLRILEEGNLVTAISIDAVGGSQQTQIQSIGRAVKSVGGVSIALDGKRLQERELLGAFFLSSGSANTTLLEEASLYRTVCDIVGKLQTVSVVVHNAEDADRQVLSMLSRVARYAARNGFTFRVVLIGDIPLLTKNTYYTGIRVDRFVPKSAANRAFDELSRHRYSTSEFTQSKTGT